MKKALAYEASRKDVDSYCYSQIAPTINISKGVVLSAGLCYNEVGDENGKRISKKKTAKIKKF